MSFRFILTLMKTFLRDSFVTNQLLQIQYMSKWWMSNSDLSLKYNVVASVKILHQQLHKFYQKKKYSLYRLASFSMCCIIQDTALNYYY